MLTRRDMLRSLGVAGTAVAAPALLSGCGDTALPRRRASSGPLPVELTVDRPFLFVIHDVETATPLFIGRVNDPTKG